MNNPDYRMYPHVFNVLTQKGQHMPPYFELLIDPYDNPALVEEAEKGIDGIDIPVYTGAGWYAYTLQDPSQRRAELFRAPQGAEEARLPRPRASGAAVPFVPRRDPALARPLAQRHRHRHDERAAGALLADGRQRMAHGERLAACRKRSGPSSISRAGSACRSRRRCRRAPTTKPPPDAFVQMPPTQTNKVQSLRYMSDPLPHDLLVAGPSVLNLFASIDQDDTNWIVSLKDVGPDVSVRTVREGERELPTDLPEREVARGWLKASHRAVDAETLQAGAALASAHARGAEAGHARRGDRIRHRDHGDGQSVPPRPPHLHRHCHQPTCRPASPAPPMPNTCPTTSAAAAPRCTRSTMTASGPRICCCRSFRNNA